MAPLPPVYLDGHATTPCDPRVLDAMLPALREDFGNASSPHLFGRRAAGLVEAARAEVAALVGGEPREVVFTSGATESANLAIKGAAEAHAGSRRHVVTCRIEHPAVLDACARLESRGWRVTRLRPGPDGRLDPGAVEEAIEDDTVLVSVMWAQNEIGTIHPVREIGAVCRNRGVLFHCDAVQALAWLPCDVHELGVDLLSISAHKMYGPKGAGVLWARRRRPRARLVPQLDGGGHERGLRSGTLNVPGVVGLGRAAALVREERERDARHARRLRDRLLAALRRAVPDLHVNGSLEHRLPGSLNLTFPGVPARRIAASLPDIALSAGAACSTRGEDASRVLRELGATPGDTLGGVRVGIGRFNREEEIDRAAEALAGAVARLRAEPEDDPAAAACDADAGAAANACSGERAEGPSRAAAALDAPRERNL